VSFVISHPDLEGTAVIPERALATYAGKGWVLRARSDHDAPAAVRPALRQPAKSDSAAEWKTYAVALGMDFDKAMAMTRDELAEHHSPTPPAEPKRPQRNDSTDSWRAYAVTRGLAPDVAAALSRDGDDGLIAYIDQLDADQTQES
jgi:hypothetical protein